jgi:hypothetical protein
MEIEANLVWNQSSFTFFVKWQEPKVLEIQKISPKMGPNAPLEIKRKNYHWNQRFVLKSKNWTTLEPISLNVLNKLTSYIALLWWDNVKLHYHF